MSDKRGYSASLCVLICSVCVAAMGCGERGARELAVPKFDPRAPFQELSSGGEVGASGASASVQAASDFEQAIAESMAQDAGEDAPSAEEDAPLSDAVQIQTVRLPGGLASSIPLDFDTWQWNMENGRTLVTYRAPGATSPDAMIYAEPFSALVRSYPSQEMARFRRFADPSFIPLFEVLNSPEQFVAAQLRAQGVDPAVAARALDALDPSNSPTQSSPKPVFTLNYQSSRNTFSGWRWFGHNPAEVMMRFGRTEGQWRAPDSGGEGALSNAWMLLGSADLGAGLGTHIAIICKQSPQCPVAEELSAFLAGMAAAQTL